MMQIQLKNSAVCKMYKKMIEKAMAYEKGVESADLDVPTQVLTVQYRPAKTNPEKIRKVVTKVGYDAHEVPGNPRAYNKRDDCCEKDKGIHID